MRTELVCGENVYIFSDYNEEYNRLIMACQLMGLGWEEEVGDGLLWIKVYTK